jgi:phospholipid transport system substrate-binding protein
MTLQQEDEMKSISWVVVVVLLSVPSLVRAGTPTDQLSASINEFITILSNTPVAQLQASGLPESARRLVFARFDFSEMTKRSLGSHWESLDQGEQGEFVEAFAQWLLVAYGKTVRSSVNEKIQFTHEIQEGTRASVKSKIVNSDRETPIDYRLHDIDGQWKVYDVLIDHVSLVNNYRAQFDRVIAKSSVQELLRKMKNQE